jgi:hypothetical protein
MIESPLLEELMADGERAGQRKSIMLFLVTRFGPSARDVRSVLNTITDDKKLEELTRLSASCPDLESFKKLLPPGPRKRR